MSSQMHIKSFILAEPFALLKQIASDKINNKNIMGNCLHSSLYKDNFVFLIPVLASISCRLFSISKYAVAISLRSDYHCFKQGIVDIP